MDDVKHVQMTFVTSRKTAAPAQVNQPKNFATDESRDTADAAFVAQALPAAVAAAQTGMVLASRFAAPPAVSQSVLPPADVGYNAARSAMGGDRP